MSFILLLFVAGAVGAAESRTIIVGGDRDYPPYEYLDKDGQPAGYNVDLTRAIAEVMGMEIEIHLGAWGEMRRALSTGEIDALQGMSYSEQRAKEVDFSPPHTIVHHTIFARAGETVAHTLAELRGKSVMVQRDGIMHDYLASHDLGVFLVPVATQADALRLLAAGQHDYAVVAKLPGLYLQRELGLSNLVPLGDPVTAERYGYAVGKGEAELLSRFSEGLAILKNTGRYQAIYDHWLGVLEPPGLSSARVARYGALILAPLLLVLGGTILWSRMLQKQVAHRTEALACEVVERKRAMTELQLRQDQLIQADKLACLGILVSGVAHEINNPNGMLLLNLPRLIEAWEDAEPIFEERLVAEGDFQLGALDYTRMREEIPLMLSDMLEGSRRIKRIVEDLKDFARRDDSDLSDVVDINAIVRTSVRLVDNSIKNATDRFRIDCAAELPSVLGNAQRIEQVIVNLVLNACQALSAPEQGIEVTTAWDAEGRRVLVRVRDEGRGILPEHLAHLTDPFFTTKRDCGGTGLGLSVSDGIIKEHGGSLEFISTPGAGTTVVLALPVSAKEGL